MRLEKHNFQVLTLTERERKAFEIVDEILGTFQRNNFEKAELRSEFTGELIKIEELARVRGVLGFFALKDELHQIISIINPYEK